MRVHISLEHADQTERNRELGVESTLVSVPAFLLALDGPEFDSVLIATAPMYILCTLCVVTCDPVARQG
jgi:hypothetical protein